MVYTIIKMNATGVWVVGTADSVTQAAEWGYKSEDIFDSIDAANAETDKRNKLWE